MEAKWRLIDMKAIFLKLGLMFISCSGFLISIFVMRYRIKSLTIKNNALQAEKSFNDKIMNKQKKLNYSYKKYIESRNDNNIVSTIQEIDRESKEALLGRANNLFEKK